MANRALYTTVGSCKALKAILRDTSGPLDLTGAVVRLQARLAENDSLAIEGSAVVDPDAVGLVSYIPTQVEADAFVAGQYSMKWKVTAGGVSFYVPDDGHDALVIGEQL